MSEFAEKQQIPYPLLSDVHSDVIRRYDILNTEIAPGEIPVYGIPFPGTYVTDEDGVVVAKFFHDSYKKRDSPEILIDAALGNIQLDESAPQATRGDQEVRVTAAVRGGKGTIRQGIVRHLVVRFEMGTGLHVYGEPVPEGMLPVRIEVASIPGLVFMQEIRPPSEALRLSEMGLELQVWSGTADFILPFYPTGELASEVRPLDMDSVNLEVSVRFQACDDHTCLLPRTENFSLEVPLDVIDVPALGLHMGHGQREATYSSMPHARRLFARKIRESPLGAIRFVAKLLGMQIRARSRQLKS